MNDKKALEIFEACLDELYQTSKPPTTWALIKKKYGGTKKTFYDKHRIKTKDYETITNKYREQLDKYYKNKFDFFLLDYAPTVKQ